MGPGEDILSPGVGVHRWLWVVSVGINPASALSSWATSPGPQVSLSLKWRYWGLAHPQRACSSVVLSFIHTPVQPSPWLVFRHFHHFRRTLHHGGATHFVLSLTLSPAPAVSADLAPPDVPQRWSRSNRRPPVAAFFHSAQSFQPLLQLKQVRFSKGNNFTLYFCLSIRQLPYIWVFLLLLNNDNENRMYKLLYRGMPHFFLVQI